MGQASYCHIGKVLGAVDSSFQSGHGQGRGDGGRESGYHRMIEANIQTVPSRRPGSVRGALSP